VLADPSSSPCAGKSTGNRREQSETNNTGKVSSLVIRHKTVDRYSSYFPFLHLNQTVSPGVSCSASNLLLYQGFLKHHGIGDNKTLDDNVNADGFAFA
jgi:hypothetical protein